MKPVLERPHFAVFDDFLAKAAWQRLHTHIADEMRLTFINRIEHLSVWSPDDGHPLTSVALAVEVDKRAACKPSLQVGDGDFSPFPSDAPQDAVVRALLARMPAFSRWLGTPGRSWRTLTARAFVYPQGTGLDWHDDGGAYRGAFTYYAHAEWRPQWGGELLIAEPRGRRYAGEFVLPAPNRLVVLAGGVAHKVARVSSSAGANHRTSVSGFFAKGALETVSDGSLTTALAAVVG